MKHIGGEVAGLADAEARSWSRVAGRYGCRPAESFPASSTETADGTYSSTMVEALERVEDPRHRAFLYFAAATRRQFYFDGNKRTARLMMSGTLLSHGFDAVNVAYARRLEFNEALDDMFTTDDATSLLRFFGTC